MPSNWDHINASHVLEAICVYNQNPNAYTRSVSTFLVHDGRRYPAKAIRGIAYGICHGRSISQSDFQGGQETMRFFRRLGFNVDYLSHRKHGNIRSQRASHATKVRLPKPGLDVVRQKNALQALLQRRFGVVISEKEFDWLRVPGESQFNERYSRIVEALHEHRGAQHFYKSGTRLIADFYVEALKLVIEYDERQHFTQPRRITLDHYPSDMAVGFSIPEWQQTCDSTRAVDSGANRDETRAFYDTIRDFEITRKGLKLIRIRHGAVDWEGPEASAALTALLSPFVGEKAARGNGEGSATSGLGITLARAVLNVGLKPAELRELGSTGSDSDMWLGHRRQLARTYLADKRRYVDRLGKLIASARENGAEILLLPACTFVYENGEQAGDELRHYYELCRDIPWIVSGALGVKGADAGQKAETTVVLKNGEMVENFPSGRAAIVQMGRLTSYSACSSSIGQIRGGTVFSSKAFPSMSGSPILALDSGHHQYGGRYLRTLNSVSKWLGRHYQAPNLVVLSYWKYRDGQTFSSWLVAGDMKPNIEMKRLPSIVAGDAQEDFLSLVHF